MPIPAALAELFGAPAEIFGSSAEIFGAPAELLGAGKGEATDNGLWNGLCASVATARTAVVSSNESGEPSQ